MNKSESIDKLAEALSKAQGEMRFAAKDSTNPHFKSKYADLAAIWEAVRVPLSKHGLSVVQLPGRREDGAITLTTLLCHESGQWIGSDMAMKATQESPQAAGSCLTYLRRYMLAAVAGVAQDDDDGHAASHNGSDAAKSNGVAKPPVERQPRGKFSAKDNTAEVAAAAAKANQELGEHFGGDGLPLPPNEKEQAKEFETFRQVIRKRDPEGMAQTLDEVRKKMDAGWLTKPQAVELAIRAKAKSGDVDGASKLLTDQQALFAPATYDELNGAIQGELLSKESV